MSYNALPPQPILPFNKAEHHAHNLPLLATDPTTTTTPHSITVHQLIDFDELCKLWPRLIALAEQSSLGEDADGVLRLFLRCLSDGAILIIRNSFGLAGSCCVLRDGNVGLLLSIPSSQGENLGKHCLEAVKAWARLNSITELRVTSTKLTGATYRYFEESLGFRRHSVTFTKQL